MIKIKTFKLDLTKVKSEIKNSSTNKANAKTEHNTPKSIYTQNEVMSENERGYILVLAIRSQRHCSPADKVTF